MYSLVKHWLPLIVWLSFIFYLSSLPNLTSGFEPALDLILRKLAHMAEYGVLMVLFTRLLANQSAMSFSRILACAALFSLLYAVFDEFHQLFVENREGTLRDVAIDSIGIAIIPLLLASSNQVAKKLATWLKPNDGQIRIHRIPL